MQPKQEQVVFGAKGVDVGVTACKSNGNTAKAPIMVGCILGLRWLFYQWQLDLQELGSSSN